MLLIPKALASTYYKSATGAVMQGNCQNTWLFMIRGWPMLLKNWVANASKIMILILKALASTYYESRQPPILFKASL